MRGLVQASKAGADASIVVSGMVLFVSWALAVYLRNRDHWLLASSPPVLDASGRPMRRRTWWLLFPFFNLAFITSLVALIDKYKDRDTAYVSDYVKDDKLWWVLPALGLRGATGALDRLVD